MKFYCNGMDLSNATNIVSKAVAANKNIPILEGIKIVAHGKCVVLSAFNQEIYIEKTILADIYEEGEVIINGKIFNDCANKISNIERIGIERTAENKIEITFGKSSFELNYYEGSGFATLGNISDENMIKIKENEFKELLERAIFCVSGGNESRLLLKSCTLELKDGELEAVCLDGFRLAISKKTPNETQGTLKCVVLGKIVTDIIKILSDNEDIIRIICEKKSLLIDMGHTKIRTTLIESEYFDYRKTLPDNQSGELIINKQSFEESLNRASILSRDNHNNGIVLSIDDNVVSIECKTEKGKIKEVIECKYEGEPLTIGLSNKFLMDAITRIKEDYVKIIVESSKKPVMVKKMDGEDYRCIIQPMRLLG